MPDLGYELYLVRHGVAEDRGDAWPDDTKRPLTDDGVSRMRKGARALERFGIEFDVILASPLTRTRQTAEILSAAFDPRPPVVACDALAPEGTWAALSQELEKQGRRRRVAIVGHEPGIGELASRLVGARQAIAFKKGAVCRIDVDQLPPDGHGVLRWFLPPRVLRRLK